MKGIEKVSGYAVSLNVPDVDTDQIIPARFLLRSRDAGYGDLLFRDSRFDKVGKKNPDHVLNGPADQPVSILLAGENFGCGSAREQAAYALYDYGIRAVIAPGFGEIFRQNCVRTGIIPATVSKDVAGILHAWLGVQPKTMSVVLRSRLVVAGEHQVTFELEDINAERLFEGRDEIEETLELEAQITAFEKTL